MPDQPNPTADEYAVTTVLTRDPSMMRQMLYARMERCGIRIASMFVCKDVYGSGPRFYSEKPNRNDVELLKIYVDELNECVELLGQVGWKRTKGER